MANATTRCGRSRCWSRPQPIGETRVPPAPMELARALNNLAEVARNNGGYAEALKHLEEAVPICQRIYGRDDVRLAEVYSNLAGVLSAQGRYKAAIDQYRQTIEICRSGEGPTTRRAKELLATTLVNTAMLYKSQRQFREAARYCAMRWKSSAPRPETTKVDWCHSTRPWLRSIWRKTRRIPPDRRRFRSTWDRRRSSPHKRTTCAESTICWSSRPAYWFCSSKR